ncbi:MAG: hypothetical protein COB62_03655 [Piscirickettsiaceae bacterium]|nr:MAG: hypothetical protein COB62_03655 [Piscirickettsiaceae bacterium]
MPSSKMKILFISRAYPPTVGGIENQNEALARHLSKLLDCKLIVNRGGKKALPFFIPWAIIKGLIKIRSSDQLLLGDGVAAIIGWFITLFTNKPISCVLHGLDITWDNYIYQKLWVSFFFKRIDHFIAVSHSTKAIAINAGIPEDKIHVIPNGVEKSPFKPSSKEDLQRQININLDTKFILLTLGRLVERKGVYWFIENVFTKLPKHMVYLVAGNGPEYDRIQSLIKKLNLSQNIYLLGSVDEQLKESLFTHCDIFIQPNIPVKNDAEGFGITQLEAGICGLPSISSNLEGIKDAIQEDKNGWLVEPLNIDAYIKTVLEKETLLKQQQTLIKKQVAQYCQSHFDWPIIAKRYVDTLSPSNMSASHRAGFSPTTNRESKAKKILKVLDEARGEKTANLSILDIGTGNGEISSFIGKTNNVSSVDICDTRQSTDNFTFYLCNESLPFQSESFDIVISNHVIEHVHDPKLHISEIKRVLKKNGLLYLATPNRLWPFEVHYKLFFLHYLPPQLFIKSLKTLNLYKEDVTLTTLNDVRTLLGKNTLTSYSGKIIKEPKKYLMNISPTLEKILNSIPDKLLNLTTFIHPTFIFVYKKDD